MKKSIEKYWNINRCSRSSWWWRWGRWENSIVIGLAQWGHVSGVLAIISAQWVGIAIISYVQTVVS